ncbi:MAG: winged helix DNA-binding domain-containing protein [Aquiluna sp.]|nr:winged helix DNA-binding domain-containing protein [Aquiluna sp.]MCF8545735.1 winged helix DNA-binding domain-containing protein [Aquiluna sp.]
MTNQLSASQARHLALNSLGIGANTGQEGLLDVLSTLNLFQLDSVNVFERAHLLPAFSRIGAYSIEEFQDLAFGTKQGTPHLTEYWAHCAALITKEDWALFEFRRREYRENPKIQRYLKDEAALETWVKKELLANGPMTISEFEHDANKRTGNWWGWSGIKIILERLYFIGEVVSAGRRNFSRLYALPEQVGLVENTSLNSNEQRKALLLKASGSLGVGTLDDIADYYRMNKKEARPLISELVEENLLAEVRVEGWERPGYAKPNTLKNLSPFESGERKARIFSPFDPLIWRRERLSRIFDFEYQIEIYLPEDKRKYGYYTLPILHEDKLVGRVDLKNDRKSKTLNVLSLWSEPWLSKADLKRITPDVVAELELAKQWVGAETLNPPSKGNWAFGGGSN